MKKDDIKIEVISPPKEDEEETYGCDSKEYIDRCLNCERPKCTNCLDGIRTSSKKNRRKKDEGTYYIIDGVKMTLEDMMNDVGMTPKGWASTKHRLKYDDVEIYRYYLRCGGRLRKKKEKYVVINGKEEKISTVCTDILHMSERTFRGRMHRRCESAQTVYEYYLANGVKKQHATAKKGIRGGYKGGSK